MLLFLMYEIYRFVVSIVDFGFLFWFRDFPLKLCRLDKKKIDLSSRHA